MDELESRVSAEIRIAFGQAAPRILEKILAAPESASRPAGRPRARIGARRAAGLALAAACAALGIFGWVRAGEQGTAPARQTARSASRAGSDRIYFNEARQERTGTAGYAIRSAGPVRPEDIAKEFGKDPLAEIRLPQDLYLRVGNGQGDSNAAYFGENRTRLYYMSLVYGSRTQPAGERGLGILLQHGSQLAFHADIDVTGPERVSVVDGTEVTLMRVTEDTRGYPVQGECYQAEFLRGSVRFGLGSRGLSRAEFLRVLRSLLG